MLQTILITFIVIGCWGILLRMLENVDKGVFTPILNLIRGRNYSNKLLYVIFCIPFMTVYRIINWLPMWVVAFICMFVYSHMPNTPLTVDMTFNIIIGGIILAGLQKAYERTKEAYTRFEDSRFYNMPADQLIEECKKSRRIVDFMSQIN